MDYPEELIIQANNNMQGHHVEGFLSGHGKINPTLMFIGEAPGKNEILTKQPFTGRAGKILDNYLATLNLTRKQVYITSTVRSRPYKPTSNDIKTTPNRKPTSAEVKAHAHLLDYEIKVVQPKIIATLGDTALKRLLGTNYQLQQVHGQVLNQNILFYNSAKQKYQLTDKKYYIVPLYHPAAIFYNRKLQPTIEQDLQNLKDLIQKVKRG